jgi:cell division protein FtsB
MPLKMSGLWVRRLTVATAFAVALGYVPYHVYSRSGLARYLKLRGERDQLHEANLRTHVANQRLRAELEALSDGEGQTELSRAAIERAARDELGLVRPGEVVFQLEARAP